MKFRLVNVSRHLDLVKEFDNVPALLHELQCNSFRYSAFQILDSDNLEVYRQEADGDFYIVGYMDYHTNEFHYSSFFERRLTT